MTLEKVTAHVHRLGSEWVGWYLQEAEGRFTVVDCGFAGYFEQLPAALAELGHGLDAVDAVVLTHYHSDHVGAAERIRAETGARVYAPEGDAAGVRGGKIPPPDGLIRSLWRPHLVRYMAHATRNGGAKVTPVSEVETYRGGESLDVPGGLRAIDTPGHTGGHCSLLGGSTGVLFAGDALATLNLATGARGPCAPPFNEDHARAHESLGSLEPLEAEVVVVGHGEPFHGSPAEAVRQARALL